MALKDSLTQAQIDEICQVYDECRNQVETAKRTKHSGATVSKYLIANGRGCGIGGNQDKQRKITDEQILSDIQAGYTRQEIADRHGVHVENLARRMKKLGVHATYAPNLGGAPQKIFGECWHYIESQDKSFSKKQPNFQYLESRRVKSSKRVRLKCKCCQNIIERAESTVRQKTIICECCNPLDSRLGTESKQLQNKRIELMRFFIALKELKTSKICKGCGREFYSQYSTQLYCSKTCKSKEKRKLSGNYRSRARHYGCQYETGISLRAVILRDKNICQICGKPCNKYDTSWGKIGPLYPSIDHIIPLCKKGPHKWGNVQLAHMICNSEKRDLTR